MNKEKEILMKILKIISIITFVLTLTKFTTGYAASKSFKPYLCAMYPAYEMYKDDCNGSNSWYKIYFPDIYNSKEICMRESDKLFNHHIILQIFPDYKKPGDEVKSWVAGCDNNWYY